MKKITITISVIIILLICFIFVYVKAPQYVNLVLNEVEYFFENGTYDINEIQNNKLENLEEEYSKEDYTVENPFIKVAPLQNELSAIVAFNDSNEIKSISYTSKGKTETSDLKFEKQYNKSGDIYLPIIGLYANDTTNIVGNINYVDGTAKNFEYNITTEDVKIKEEDLKISYNINNDNEYNNSMNNDLIFTSNYTGYDINGDVRIAINTSDYELANKTINFEEFDYLEAVPMPAFGENDKIYKMNLMGYYYLEDYLEVPEEMTFHHDMTRDNEGNYYMLARNELSFMENVMLVLNPNKAASKPEMAEIIEYDKTGNLINEFSLGNIIDYDDTGKLNNGRSRDIHLNSIEYLDSQDLLMISSRTTSQIYFVDPQNGNVVNVFGAPEMLPANLAELQFDVINEENMQYPSGQHTAYQVNNVETNKDEILISVFDNQSCVNNEGENLYYTGEKSDEIETCITGTYRALFYKFNFNDNTVELVKEIDIDDTSAFMGNVFEHDNYYVIGKENAYIYDLNGNLIFSTNFSGSEKYRVNILEEEEMNSMI